MDSNIIDFFIETLDSLFWNGYAEQLATENPEAFTFEFNQFLNNY